MDTTSGDKRKRVDFCNDLLTDMEDDRFLPWLIFSDEATSVSYTHLDVYKRQIYIYNIL